MSQEFFKISSGLKSLIGSELITDNYVAVFELVKNAYDAGAPVVSIRFENMYSDQQKARIIIEDNGKGMSREDLLKKWLFVAYSAKKDGTEDDGKGHSYYAGNKGVGRFSCDRLGRTLDMYTKAESAKSQEYHLLVDWTKFEDDQKVEFINVPVDLKPSSKPQLTHSKGTRLVISGIPIDEWNRTNFKKLKERLSKLIRPDLNNEPKKRSFSIKLDVPEELNNDETELSKLAKSARNEITHYYQTINGEIQNFVFNELDIRTTKIESVISNGVIETKLTDRNRFIYSLKEHSPFSFLNDVGITLYFLNRSAKTVFTKKTGAQHVDYGSIFVYKNGFRVYPYGERGDDSLGIDNRALQSYNRYIGLRSLIGEITIQGRQPELREKTSRDGGLVRTKAYEQMVNLEDGYFVHILKRLEKFVVDVTDWGVNDDNIENLETKEAKENLVRLIANISNNKNVIEIRYGDDLLKLLQDQEQDSGKKIVKQLKQIASATDNDQLKQEVERIGKKFVKLRSAKESAEKVAAEKSEEASVAKGKLEHEERQSLFQKAIIGREKQDLLSLQHQIRHTANSISWSLDKLVDSIQTGENKEKLLDHIKLISLEVKKIASASQYVTRANFNMDATKISSDIIAFVNDYIENVFKEFDHYIHSKNPLKITIENASHLKHTAKFRPLELSVIIDNLASNSKKAGARNLNIKWVDENDGYSTMIVGDDGKGIEDSILKKVWEFTYSKTDGSGMGLYHVKSIVEGMGGKVTINNGVKKGVEFIIKFKK